MELKFRTESRNGEVIYFSEDELRGREYEPEV